MSWRVDLETHSTACNSVKSGGHCSLIFDHSAVSYGEEVLFELHTVNQLDTRG